MWLTHPSRKYHNVPDKGTSMSRTEDAPLAEKKLPEAWLTNTLTDILDKPSQKAIRENARISVAPITAEHYDPLRPVIGITHNINNVGDHTITTILRNMEEMENKNKMFETK